MSSQKNRFCLGHVKLFQSLFLCRRFWSFGQCLLLCGHGLKLLERTQLSDELRCYSLQLFFVLIVTVAGKCSHTKDREMVS